jgi:hypothetical protein
MEEQNRIEFLESVKVLNLIKSKKGYLLVTKDNSCWNDQYDHWLLVPNIEDIIEIDEHGDAHIGGYYLD